MLDLDYLKPIFFRDENKMSAQEKNDPDQEAEDEPEDEQPEDDQPETSQQQTQQQQQKDKEQEAANESEMVILNRIFMGEFENLPSLASKLVRIFTSSTFTGENHGFVTKLSKKC